MKKKYNRVVYYPGELYVYNEEGEIIGTVSPTGKFKPIGKRRIPPGEKRA